MRSDRRVVFPEPENTEKGIGQRMKMTRRNWLTVCALEVPPLALADLPLDVLKDLVDIIRRSL